MANEKAYTHGFGHDLGRAFFDCRRFAGERRSYAGRVRATGKRSAGNRDNEGAVAPWLGLAWRSGLV